MGAFPQSNFDPAWAVMEEYICMLSYPPENQSFPTLPTQGKESFLFLLTSVNLSYLKYYSFELDVIENLQNPVKWSFSWKCK